MLLLLQEFFGAAACRVFPDHLSGIVRCVPSRAPRRRAPSERAAARREARAARGAAMSIEEEGRKRSSKRPAPQCPADAKR